MPLHLRRLDSGRRRGADHHPAPSPLWMSMSSLCRWDFGRVEQLFCGSGCELGGRRMRLGRCGRVL